MIDHLPYFILLALIAEILGTIGGFGSSLFFVPIAAYFLDFHSVLGITALFHVSSNLSKIVLFKHGFDRRLIIWMGIPAVLFVIAGAYLSRFVPVSQLELILAIFLVTISLVFMLFRNLIVKPTLANAATGGAVSGIVAGMLGTGGAIRGIVLTAFDLKMEVFIATSAIIDLAIDASRSIVYAANGYVHTHDLYLVPILLLVSIAGTYTGKIILKHVTAQQFRSLVLILILLTGIVTLVRSFS
jgi:uncharacterized membrane protein YfcA